MGYAFSFQRLLFCALLSVVFLSSCGKKEDERAPEPVAQTKPSPNPSVTTSTSTQTDTRIDTVPPPAVPTPVEPTPVEPSPTEPTPAEPPPAEPPPVAPPPLVPAPVSPPKPPVLPPVIQQPQGYRLPEFDPRWGLKRDIFENAVRAYESRKRDLTNPRFVSVIDFSRPSSQKRFFLFDLATEKMNAFFTSHGFGSDPKHTGMAQAFSNVESSRQSSLGHFLTLQTYDGKNGLSLRLRGLDPSNNRALKRLIVVHGANYVSEKAKRAGRSDGCFVLDHDVVTRVIERIRGGSLIVAGR